MIGLGSDKNNPDPAGKTICVFLDCAPPREKVCTIISWQVAGGLQTSRLLSKSDHASLSVLIETKYFQKRFIAWAELR